jgi:predicted dithiol-disulfide oxidoreductase (DUF899 family)
MRRAKEKSAPPRPADRSHPPAASAAAEEAVAAIGLEPRHARSRWQFNRVQDLPRLRIDASQVALTAFQGPVPEFAVHPGHPGDEGSVSLADLFRGRSQLLVYRFMFGPDYKAGCPSCSMIADGFDGFAVHLANHDVTLWAVSRAPLAKLQAYKQRMGWTFPWASSRSGDFNYDFNVSVTEEQQRKGGVEYNYRHAGHALDAAQVPAPVARFAEMCGTDAPTYRRDRPGLSAFVHEDGAVYHTYSTYARGLDGLWGAYQWLDRAPRGRNETSGPWWRRHDEYSDR